MLEETKTVNEDRVQQRMEKASVCAEAFEALMACTDVEIPQKRILAGPVQLNFTGLEEKLGHPAQQVLGADNQHFAMNVMPSNKWIMMTNP